MTINGVTKSVLVPLPKTLAHTRPVTAKLPDGSTVIVVPNSFPDKGASTVANNNSVLLTTATSSSPATSALQRLTVVTALTGSGPIKRPVVTIKQIKPIVSGQRLFEGRGTVITALPRLPVPTAAHAALEHPSGQRQIVRILPPSSVQGPAGSTCVRLTPSTPAARPVLQPRVYKVRPIILRRNEPCPTRSAAACTVVVRPCVVVSAPVTSSSTPIFVNSSSAALTVVSSPRTLSRREAIAAGWYTAFQPGDVDDDEMLVHDARADAVAPCTAAVVSPFAVRHIVPMDSCDYECPDVDEFVDKPLGGALETAPDMVADSDTLMKVIEIVPDDDVDVPTDQDDDVKRSVMPVIKDELTSGRVVLDDDQLSRQCSSVSTETAVSEGELSREDFVVLAEWSHDELPGVVSTRPPPRRVKRHRRTSTRRSCRPVYTARRTGGRPLTAAERHRLVDCFVSLPVLRLTKPVVDVRSAWRLVCCRKNETQRCRCVSAVNPDSVTAEMAGVVQPSLVASRSDTLPVQLSGPTSDDGVTPLVVRQPDGTLASVVAKRTTPGGSAHDAHKKKYLLIKAKTGSFLVPVNNLPSASDSAAATSTTCTAAELPAVSLPCTSPVDVKPSTVSDASGHRARIQQLKEQIRQQEEQLNNIRSQRCSSAVQKFDLDSFRY